MAIKEQLNKWGGKEGEECVKAVEMVQKASVMHYQK